MMRSTVPPVHASDEPPGRAPLSSWYTQGPSDGFGDRLLMFDNAATGPLELLRVRPDFSLLPDFEASIRARLDRLSSFSHPGFAQVRAINHLDNDEGLTVVSTHVPGTRLSDWFPASRSRPGMHPVLARWTLGELTSAMAALHAVHGVAHGALAPERIVITADRHVVITDYIFGHALDAMHLPVERLWAEFHVVHDPQMENVSLDQRDDVVQLALIGLSLVIGRRVTPLEYAREGRGLIEEFAVSCERQAPASARGLRAWMEQALGPNGFRSAIDAELALLELAAAPEIEERSARSRETAGSDQALVAAVRGVSVPRASAIASVEADDVDETEMDAPSRPRFRLLYLIAAALAVLGVVQGAVIARLVFRSSAQPASAPTPGPATVARGADGTSAAPATPAPDVVAPPAAPAAQRPGALIATSQGRGSAAALTGDARTGTLRIESPMDFEVTAEGRRVSRSSRSAMNLSAGTHELTLVNSALGVRTTQTVRIEAGRALTLTVAVPRGSLSANAQPWAQVSIDGAPIGETPLANVAVPVGEHEIVFRHPQLGERRQRVTVRGDAVTRVSASFTP